MKVIATAGHVDHGKSSLLRVLTGMEPSRLAEEKRRGMTMQLGYVWFTGTDGLPVGIVDVPGHADYRMAMLTGASAVDGFIFICAADDGWMPQSEEHLWSLAALGINSGVVVMTKCDLVPPSRLDDLRSELEIRFYEAFGREFPIVPFSAITKAGLEEMRSAITAQLAADETPADRGSPYMFVDRVFSVQGQGTVVTGTLRDGSLGERQRVELIPSGKTAQIRSLQTYGKQVLVARPNSRVAIQLANIAASDIPRDTQIALSGASYTTEYADILFRPFADYRINPKKSPEVVVVHGGVRTKAVMNPISPVSLTNPGAAYYVRLNLSCARWLKFHDRVLIVSSGNDKILGGGTVVDEQPTKGLKKAAERLPLINEFTFFEYATHNIAKQGYLRRPQLAARTRFLADDLERHYETFAECFVYLEDWITDAAHVDTWQDQLLTFLADYHKKNPTEEGAAESTIAKSFGLPEGLLRAIIRTLKQASSITQVGPNLKLMSHTPRVDRTSLIADKLMSASQDPRPCVLSMFELEVKTDQHRRLLARLIADGHFVRMDERHVMAGNVFRDLSSRVVQYIASNGPQSAAAIRDHLGIGRKVVIMLLEVMDGQKLTARSGEVRAVVERTFHVPS